MYFDQKKEKIDYEGRINTVIDFVNRNKRVPSRSRENENSIAMFLKRLRSGEYYRDKRDGWIIKLTNAHTILSGYFDQDIKRRRKIDYEEYVNTAISFVEKNKCLPSKSKEDSLYRFLYRLRGGESYKKNRDAWIKKLSESHTLLKKYFNRE